MVPFNKFDSLCKELENALNREQKAEILLKQQTIQIEEITNKLALISSQELESFKLNVRLLNFVNMLIIRNLNILNEKLLNETTSKLNKKDKQIKQLTKKLSNLEVMKENYEKSACSILM